jgi:hypothetical protein
MGLGVSNPSSLMARATGALKGNSANVFIGAKTNTALHQMPLKTLNIRLLIKTL